MTITQSNPSRTPSQDTGKGKSSPKAKAAGPGASSQALRRRRPLHIALALLLIIGTAVGAGALWSARQTTMDLVVAAGPIAAGQVITEKDLAVATVATSDQGLTGLRTRSQSMVVGKTAVAAIPKGTMMTLEMVGDGLRLPSRTDAVGLSLARGFVPPEIAPGMRVRIIAVPGNSTRQAAGIAPRATHVAAGVLVLAVRPPDQSGRMVVTLAVPAAALAQVTSSAAAGQIAITLQGGGR